MWESTSLKIQAKWDNLENYGNFRLLHYSLMDNFSTESITLIAAEALD